MRSTAEFDDFYAGSSARLLGQIYLVTGSRADAEDAVAEAYARAWQRWSHVRECDNPEAWVRQVAGRIAVSTWRKSINRLRAQRRAAPTERMPGLGPEMMDLVQQLRRLPAEQRQAIMLHHIVGLSVAEISAEIKVPDGTVKARLSRGRTTLARHLASLETQEAGHE